ncbi:AVAST type 1 anti-phage system protein Avs1c [Ralstonia solanacearum]|uniref:AVAST type 1 anti-phage system protein Avs1c n=1 Tax=Ralstonia solanacearum TaxID=305 RepID=UPI0018D0BA3E|nr:AVAST type 1 anti-phage system protein Avs1c [Ralstonia solanacearum]
MTREEFEERINLVRERLQSGKMHPNGMEGMLNVRLLPNGRIDMLSVDESVRLTANMTHQMTTTDMGKMLRKLSEYGEGL